MKPKGQKLGRIIGYSKHADYLVSLYRDGEIDTSPKREDCSIGRFVRIGEGDHKLMGIIVSSQLITEEGLRSGAFHHGMPAGEMDLFTPELMDGSMSIIKVRGIGVIDMRENVVLGIPSFTPVYQDPVIAMSDEEIRSAHMDNEKLRLAYLRELNGMVDRGTRVAVTNALKHLETVLPEHSVVINLLRREMEWNDRTTE